jgi:hypothetical protein
VNIEELTQIWHRSCYNRIMELEKLFRLSEAKLEASKGELAKAAEIISATFNTHPGDPDARQTLAEIVGQNGRRDLEIGILAELLQEQSDNWRVAEALYKVLQSENRLTDATDVLAGFAIANPHVEEAISLCQFLGLDLRSIDSESR